jgi:hypothetical protein
MKIAGILLCLFSLLSFSFGDDTPKVKTTIKLFIQQTFGLDAFFSSDWAFAPPLSPGATYVSKTTAFKFANFSSPKGESTIFCVQLRGAVQGSCQTTLDLPEGSIIANGFYDQVGFGPTFTNYLAIAGGTRAFLGAQGQLKIIQTPINQITNNYDLSYELLD